MLKKLPPFKHQTKSIKFFEKINCGYDTSDPGTGKTRVQIDLFTSRRKRGGGKLLVIAPKSLLRSAWAEDFAKFSPGMRVSVATAANREQAFKQTADVYITNIDAVKWLLKQKPAFFRDFESLVIDEVTAFKHHTSQRSKALNKIKKHFKYRYGLTGTPAANGILDMWHQLLILDDGQRLGKSFFQFRSAVCEPKQVGPMPNMVQWVDKPGAEMTVSSLIADITVRHKFEECVDIPEHHMYTVPYDMSPRQTRAYMEMERDALVFLNNGVSISAVNAAVVSNKLMQIASGASYTGDEPSDVMMSAVMDAVGYALVDTARYEMVAELVEARKHSVVFFNWRHQRDELIKEFKARGITFGLIDGSVPSKQREQYVTDFQAGFYRVILAHPQSAAHGLTLTRGTSTIWCSPTHNLEHFIQGNRRIYRAGQKNKTETVVVVAKDTIEGAVYERCAAKGAKQDSVLDLLKDYFKTKP